MQVTLTVHRPDAYPIDVRISTRGSVGLADVAALLPVPFSESPPRPLFSNGTLLPARARLGDPGLRNGCVLSVSGIAERAIATSSVLLLKIIAGPDCGRVISLRRGRHVIGRGAEADIALDDPNLSRCHACLWVDAHAVEVQDLGSTNGTLIDGIPIDAGRHRLALPGLIAIGATQLEIVAAAEPPAAAVADGTGVLLVRRPPRSPSPAEPAMFSMPAAPAAAPRPRIQWLTALLPLVLSMVLAVMLHSVQLLAFVALSPVTVLASTVAERRSWRRKQHEQTAEYDRTRQANEQAVKRALSHELADSRRIFADAASILLSATRHDCRLWERRPTDGSFLALRLGLADQPAQASVNRMGVVAPAGTLPMAPAVIALTERTLGVAGPDHCLDGLRRWLLGQAVVLHSPTELSTIVITDQSHGPGWRWLRWLPTSAPAIAISAERRRQVAEQLSALIRQRRQLHQPTAHRWPGCWTLVVIDPADLVLELPQLNEVINEGPLVGLAVISFARDHEVLPAGCSATLRLANADGTEARLTESGRPQLEVHIDRVSPSWAEQVARSLACLRDAEDVGPTAHADHQVRLTDLLGLTEITAAAVRQRWRARPERPIATMGIGNRGQFEIDLVRDGPHLLVAGTTGSGKSELLRVLITSLAIQHPPTELTFVLIDYKGGAAFADCAELPHVTAMVTDLDPRMTQRALASLNAELRRREQALAHAGVSEFINYRHSTGSADIPLPRLVLVIDEFASLAEELPNMLAGLLDVAQRGRSLGVHLVLATQRPAGVLSANIRANMGLRIALRMSDVAESVDVVGIDAASRISRDAPGRAVARHADGQLEEFQTACVSQPARPDETVTVTELDEWNQPLVVAQDPGEPTELTVAKQAMVAAAAGLPRPTPPWLQPLPAVLRLDPSPGSTVVVFGRSDEPADQRQSPVGVDLSCGGSIAVIGGPRSGRTTALRTIIGTAVSQLAPDQLQVYAIDCAGAALRPLRQLAHCGAVLDATEPAAIARLIARLTAERQHRQQQFADLGVSDFAEARAAGGRLPAVLVAVDGWDGLSSLSEEMDAGRSAELFVQLLRDAPSAGFTFLVGGDRGTLGARIAPVLGRKLLLPLADRADYAMAGLSMAAVPTRPAPGRAVTAEDGIEVQIGLLSGDTYAAAQWRSLAATALTKSAQPGLPAQPPGTSRQRAIAPTAATRPSIRMRPLPTTVDAAGLLKQRDPKSPGGCLLGIGSDDASVVECDLLRPHSRFLIAGPDGSGRSNAALLIARQARSSGRRVLVAATVRSPLAGWAAENQITCCLPGELLQDLDADLLVVDDAEHFTDTVTGEKLHGWIAQADGAIVVTARMPDLLTSFRGPGAEMRRHRSGLLLQPAAGDGEVLGIRLPHLPPSNLAGRGVLVTAETRGGIAGYEPIQVAA